MCLTDLLNVHRPGQKPVPNSWLRCCVRQLPGSAQFFLFTKWPNTVRWLWCLICCSSTESLFVFLWQARCQSSSQTCGRGAGTAIFLLWMRPLASNVDLPPPSNGQSRRMWTCSYGSHYNLTATVKGTLCIWLLKHSVAFLWLCALLCPRGLLYEGQTHKTILETFCYLLNVFYVHNWSSRYICFKIIVNQSKPWSNVIVTGEYVMTKSI